MDVHVIFRHQIRLLYCFYLIKIVKDYWWSRDEIRSRFKLGLEESQKLIDSGSLTSFGNDVWVGNFPFPDQFPRFVLNQTKTSGFRVHYHNLCPIRHLVTIANYMYQ